MARRPAGFHLVAWLTRGIAAVSIVSTFSLSARAELPPGNVVQQWNKLAEDTVVGSNAFQNEGLIYMAYVSAAVYDAVAALEGGYEPYGRHIPAPPGASVEAAAVEAAHTTLRHYFPAQEASLAAWRDEALALIPNGPAKLKGIATGRTAAKEIIELRGKTDAWCRSA